MNPEPSPRLTLSTLPKHFRQIALWFVITLTVGYTTGLVFVAHTTSLSPKGVEERYRGNENDVAAMPAGTTAGLTAGPTGGAMPDDTTASNMGVLTDTASTGVLPSDTASLSTTSSAPADEPEMKFEKSLPEMLNITHTHILAMTSVLALAAAIFALSSRASSRLKSFLIVEPFVAILTSFVAMWLMRYVHPAFSYLLMASSGSFAICFYVMMGFALVELAKGRDEG